MEKQKKGFLSLDEINKSTGISATNILEKVNESTFTNVYSFISSQNGVWSHADEPISMGNFEGYLEVPSQHLVSAYHHLLNSIEVKPFSFLVFSPSTMPIFGCGSLEALEYSSDGQSTVTHSWRCITKNGLFDGIRITSRKNLKSHDFSLEELLDTCTTAIQAGIDEQLESESALANKEHDWNEELLEPEDILAIETKRTLEQASHYLFAEYQPSSNEIFTFDLSNLYLDSKHALKLFPQLVHHGKSEESKVNQGIEADNSAKLELLVCDLVLIFLKMSAASIKLHQDNNTAEQTMVRDFLSKLKPLLRVESDISINSFKTLFDNEIVDDFASLYTKKRPYSFPKLLTEVLKNNQEYLEEFNLVTKLDEKNKNKDEKN